MKQYYAIYLERSEWSGPYGTRAEAVAAGNARWPDSGGWEVMRRLPTIAGGGDRPWYVAVNLPLGQWSGPYTTRAEAEGAAHTRWPTSGEWDIVRTRTVCGMPVEDTFPGHYPRDDDGEWFYARRRGAADAGGLGPYTTREVAEAMARVAWGPTRADNRWWVVAVAVGERPDAYPGDAAE